MVPEADLNSIARAEATPVQARKALLAAFGNPSPELLRDTYLVLRSWAWKALDQRRRDPELRDWCDILAAASSSMALNGQPGLAERLTALGELLAESIAVSEALSVHEVTKRQHVVAALEFLERRGGQVNRADIAKHLSLGQANLTRVLNLMSAAGLVDRTTLGKEAVFSLSRAGFEARHA
ncbi:helix-turn-helix transcriptional regulator [Paracraurococcus lichenis]|uniref:MarR family transcriptional regulator n=1 Tax=Paracraurococcus lichenis TaxID=3064888 RepID=A0ABT9ECZ3_9PROT|nr:MarR family transcriptional regulator [Paracraurococcus sp. LOR1-02]MDO9714084.1 MarR family transcriptional regulator [Paracraurococcus sp. LOR1-02]